MKTARRMAMTALVALVVGLGFTGLASTAQAVTCSNYSTGCTTVMNSMSSMGRLEIMKGGTYGYYAAGQGRTTLTASEVLYFKIDAGCTATAQPSLYFTINPGVWYKALPNSSTTVYIKC